MYKSDLFIVFSSLSGPDKRALSNFLVSPFFNQKQDVLDLWHYLVKNAKVGAPAFKKQKVFENLFSGEDYNDKAMRYTMSRLLKTIEQFLAYSEYMTTPINETLHLSRAYKKRKQAKLFQKTLKKAKHQLSNMDQDQDYFHYNYQLEFEQYDFAESLQRSTDNNLNEMSIALDKHLLISKLKQACLLQSHLLVFKTEYDFSLVELLLDYIKNSPYKDDPSIAAFYNCFLALHRDDELAFQNLKNTIQKEQALFSDKDTQTLFLFSLNFCIRKLNTGEKFYIREAFVETFIQDYKEELLPHHRESNFTYNLARLYFTQRQYDKAMKLLHKVDDRHLLLNLNAKVMLLKLYYELKEYDALTSLLSSFKVMLTRKKVLGYHKTHYNNIIKFTNRLLNLKPRDQKAHDKLEHDIRTAEVLQEKEWLLEQLALVR